jgi:hypothetical protein
MNGKNNGVQKRILDQNPLSFFMPCGCHNLNLVLCDAAKSSVKSVTLFGVLGRLHAFACMLFNISLEKSIRDLRIERRGTIYHKSKQVLAYANDTDIIDRTTSVVKEAFVNLESAAKEMGLTVNEIKTKYMEVINNPTNTQYLSVKEYKFEKVTQFKYLGTLVTSEINHRLLTANRCHHRMQKQLMARFLNKKTKIRLYKTLL